MKRLFTTACALLLVLSLLAGCGSAPQAETTEATEAKPEPVYYADYLATFTELTEQGGFTLSELPSVDLEDRLVSYTAIASPDMLPDWNYHIRADRNSSGEVQYARIMKKTSVRSCHNRRMSAMAVKTNINACCVRNIITMIMPKQHIDISFERQGPARPSQKRKEGFLASSWNLVWREGSQFIT